MLVRRALSARCPAAAIARRRVRVQWLAAPPTAVAAHSALFTCRPTAAAATAVATAAIRVAPVRGRTTAPLAVTLSAVAVAAARPQRANASTRLVACGSLPLSDLSLRWLTTQSAPSPSPSPSPDSGLGRVVSGTAPARPDASDDRKTPEPPAPAASTTVCASTAAAAAGASVTATVTAAVPGTGSGVGALGLGLGLGAGSGVDADASRREVIRARLKSVATHVANVLAACGALATDMLWLRSAYLLANIAGLLRSAAFEPNGRPFWTGIWWALFFITANVVQMYRILTDQKDVALTDDALALYDTTFAAAFTKPEFRRLLALGAFRDVPAPGTVLHAVGDQVTTISVVLRGTVSLWEKNVPLSTLTGLPVASNASTTPAASAAPVAPISSAAPPAAPASVMAVASGSGSSTGSGSGSASPDWPSATSAESAFNAGYRHVADLHAGRFIGEGLMTDKSGAFQSSPVAVRTSSADVRLFVIPKHALMQLFLTHPSLAVNWHLLVSDDLQTKLRDTRRHHRVQTYQMMLYGILIVSRDTQLTDAQRDTVERWAADHGITHDEHKQALHACGWTMKDWRRGRARFTY